MRFQRLQKFSKGFSEWSSRRCSLKVPTLRRDCFPPTIGADRAVNGQNPAKKHRSLTWELRVARHFSSLFLLYCPAAVVGRRFGAWKSGGGVSRAPARLDLPHGAGLLTLICVLPIVRLWHCNFFRLFAAAAQFVAGMRALCQN